MNHTRLPLLDAPEMEESLMRMTTVAVFMNFSEDANRAMEVLIESMTSVCYIYDAKFHDHEHIYKAGTGEALAESAPFLLYVPS